jgi:UDP-GlcNAc:undecaprenyl-phosphate GlcNAc-1-phosphate transferase
MWHVWSRLLMALIYLGAFVLSLVAAVCTTWYVRGLAYARGWVVQPDSSRHLHTHPIPRLGGVAIYLAFGLVIAIDWLVPKMMGISPIFSIRIAAAIMVPATLVFLLGLWDDFRSLSPKVKFAVQILAAVLLYLEGFRVYRMKALFGGHPIDWAIALPLTILWVLWITNAFNLIDGLDGLAAGSALFSTLVVMVVSLAMHSTTITVLSVALAGAILGFLRFNFNPATIFLGDCGSLFLGFMLSALALAGSQKAPTMVAVAIPVVSFGLPIMDVGISVLRRFMSGKPLFGADREHIHHKLLKRGLSQREVVLILYAVSAVLGLLSLAILNGASTMAIVLVIVGAGVWLGIQHLHYHEVTELHRLAVRTISQKQIIANNLCIRRAAEELEGCATLADVCRVLEQAFTPTDFDGLQLRFPAIPGATLPLGPVQHDNGEFIFAWHRAVEPTAAWCLSVQLATSEGQAMGSFSVQRGAVDKPLLVDVNLLTSGFHLSLANAVARSLRHPVQQRPIASATPTLSATAG